jgi:hypothetical protein
MHDARALLYPPNMRHSVWRPSKPWRQNADRYTGTRFRDRQCGTVRVDEPGDILEKVQAVLSDSNLSESLRQAGRLLPGTTPGRVALTDFTLP